jgi:hypothetical protein
MLSLLLALIPTSDPSQSHAPAATGRNPFSLFQSGKFLAALEAAEQALATARPGEESMALDTLAIAQTLVGRDDEALSTFDRMESRAQETQELDLGTVVRLDAVEAILTAARGRRVVILNEAHHVPRHRSFALELSRALRKEGFTHLACETFGPKELLESAKRRRYPDRQTGFYSLEPTFGDFVRQALALGFDLVEYEARDNADASPDERMIARETQQADALLRLLQTEPKARVFVYCGYSHATENERRDSGGRDASWMASRLKRGAHLDPLTIDQTGAREHSTLELELPSYIVADEQGLDRGSVLRRRDGTFLVLGDYAGQIDMQVLHPRTIRIDGRADWTYLRGEKKGVAVPSDLIDPEVRVLVQAFLAGDADDAVPADQIVIDPGEPRAKLVLRPGNYRLVLQDRNGDELVRSDLRVE